MSPNGITTSTRNWLVKVFGLCLLAGAAMSIASCQEAKEIGLTPTTPVGVFFTDTLTVRTSTVLLDSVQTDRASRVLAGRYNDPTFGRVTARAFGMLDLGTTPTVTSLKVDADVVYDSVKLFVDYKYAYGDTTKTQQLFVHRLTEELDTAKRYTTASSAAFSPEALAQLQVPAGTPTGATSLTARLSDAVGQELLTQIKGNGTTRTAFRKVFRGLAFIPAATNSSVVSIGVAGGTGIVVYYHKPNTTSALSSGFFVDPLSYSSSVFSQVTSTRTGTALAALTTARPLAASATNGITYLQGATGVTTKLEFPTLMNLKNLGPIAINRAELSVTPSIITGNSVPFYLLLGEHSQNNQLAYTVNSNLLRYHLVQTPAYSFKQAVQTWLVPEQAAFGQVNRLGYTFDMSGYLQTLMTGFRPNNGLVMVPAASSVLSSQGAYQAQAVLNTQLTAAAFGPGSIKLVVFYTKQTQ